LSFLLLLYRRRRMDHVIFRLREPFCVRAPRPTPSHCRIAFEVPRWLSIRICRCCRVHRSCRYRLDLWPPTWPRHRRAAECPPAVDSYRRSARAPPFPAVGPYCCCVSAAAKLKHITATVFGYSGPSMWPSLV